MIPRRTRALLPALLLAVATAASAAGRVGWGAINDQPEGWYASDEARGIAASIVQYQTPEGGWPKNQDMREPPTAAFLHEAKYDHRHPTIDNGATTTQLEFLARVLSAGGDTSLRAVFDRGFDYLLAGQYPNGGWPQYYPLIEGYYTHITYNDDAMTNVLEVLRGVARATAPYAFARADQRTRAAAAVQRGLDCILRTQVRQDGRLTIWCAQYDEKTLAPAWARKFEPPSLASQESAAIVRFLLGEPAPSPEIIQAVEGAVAWFQRTRLSGLRWIRTDGPGGTTRHLEPDPAAPALWARFYELGTDRPLFMGRDSVVHYDVNEIEAERRNHYDWYNDRAAKLLERDYPRWRAKHHLP